MPELQKRSNPCAGPDYWRELFAHQESEAVTFIPSTDQFGKWVKADEVWIPTRDYSFFQSRLTLLGVSFVHMSDTELDARTRFNHYRIALAKIGLAFDHTSDTKGWIDDIGRGQRVSANFMICRMCGAASEHVPVVFYDCQAVVYRDQRALVESFMIAGKVDDVYPLIVRPYVPPLPTPLRELLDFSKID